MWDSKLFNSTLKAAAKSEIEINEEKCFTKTRIYEELGKN